MKQWEDIPGYEGSYQVSPLGLVRNRKGKILKSSNGTTGYLHVNLWKNNTYISFDIHRLVAQLFLPNPDNLKYINHKDGNKLNNASSNLEWITAKENTKHAILMGLRKDRGIDSSNAKLTEEAVREIKKTPRVLTTRQLAEKYGVNRDYINLIISGKRWKHLE